MKMLLILLLIINTIDSTYRIGYSTKYGYGFNQKTEKVINTSYRPGQFYSTSVYQPRRSPQRPYSGNWLEDLADWWRMNTDSDWPGYVDDDYWEEFLQEYPEYSDEAQQWFEEHGRTPPWMAPVGDTNILFLFCLCYMAILYGSSRNIRKIFKREQVQNSQW